MKTIAARISTIPSSATVGIADQAARMRQAGVDDILDFSAGRAFESTPDYIIQAAVTALKQGHTHQTMAIGTPDFRAAAAEKLNLLTCACSFVRAGAAAAYREPPRPEVTDLWQEWESRCAFMTGGLDAIPGLKCPMPEGGFYGWPISFWRSIMWRWCRARLSAAAARGIFASHA